MSRSRSPFDPGRETARLAPAVPALHRWFRSRARALPWRDDPSPYRVWVSEVMLQQTRVATVVGYFERWMAAFPTVGALAGAGEKEVLKRWEGLGYYARVRNLHRGAKAVVAGGGTIPSEAAELARLPGVGPYTAAAVASIAFDRDEAVVDGNVRRVLARLAAIEDDLSRPPAARALAALAAGLLPPGTAALHNQAMMELGALLCAPRSPRCAECPLADPCRARAGGAPETYPRKKAKPAVPHRDVAVGIVMDGGKLFIDRRPEKGLLGGLWEFPGGKREAGETVRQTLRRELREEFGMRVKGVRALAPVDHAYTHLKVTLHPFLCRLEGFDPPPGALPWRWIAPDELPDYPMPRGNRKIIESLGAILCPETLRGVKP